MSSIITILQGIVMGIAETVPGVSGSTLAISMGIYERILEIFSQISDIVKAFFEVVLKKQKLDYLISTVKKIDFKFAVKLGIGVLIAVLVFSHLFGFLIENFPMQTYACFFGLFVFSIPIPLSKIKVKNIQVFLIIIISLIFAYVILDLPAQYNDNPSPILLFFAGIFGVIGMILPGVSGSFIILILGVYEYIFSTIKEFTKLNFTTSDFINLASFGLGLFIGFIVFIRIFRYLLKNHTDYLMAFITGAMLGSLRVLWPFMDTNSAEQIDEMRKVSPFALPIETTITLTVIILISGGIVWWIKSLQKDSDSI